MAAKTNGKKFSAKVVKLNSSNYQLLVGDPLDAEYYGDFSPVTGQFSAIRISYPDNYYCAPRLVSTMELRNAYLRNKCRNAQDFINLIVELFEI